MTQIKFVTFWRVILLFFCRFVRNNVGSPLHEILSSENKKALKEKNINLYRYQTPQDEEIHFQARQLFRKKEIARKCHWSFFFFWKQPLFWARDVQYTWQILYLTWMFFKNWRNVEYLQKQIGNNSISSVWLNKINRSKDGRVPVYYGQNLKGAIHVKNERVPDLKTMVSWYCLLVLFSDLYGDTPWKRPRFWVKNVELSL